MTYGEFEVYYKVEPTFREDDIPKTIGELVNNYKFVKTVKTRNMEIVFSEMQGDSWSPNGEARELLEKLGLHHMSMSVGDLIRDVYGFFYVVGDMGFKRVMVK